MEKAAIMSAIKDIVEEKLNQHASIAATSEATFSDKNLSFEGFYEKTQPKIFCAPCK
jgi:hypothetical protein